MSDLHLRPATPDDAPLLCDLIYALAVYEREPASCHADPAALARHLAEDACPRCFAWIAELDGEAAGFALCYPHYSTWETNWGFYLEDLFVHPEFRGRGVGFALLQHVAAEAVERGAVRVEWQVLDWNELALDFYRRLGARPMDGWTTMRLTGDALAKLAG